MFIMRFNARSILLTFRRLKIIQNFIAALAATEFHRPHYFGQHQSRNRVALV